MAATQTEKNGTYQIRPDLKDKFRPSQVKEVIDSILEEKLTSFVYEKEAVDEMAMVISNALRNRIIEMNFPRYKYVVNVVIGELRGAGVKVAARCLWDADTDNYSSSMFVGETFFCTATVFAAYYY
ncbi:dynein light chain Tctex-type protein 2B-like [Portunus trituberculatus]|uniref:dynein light chain Tctex-type protein 2B-like n=1 Tax=Portunus trituberculatus TaxID=210409 RepID=UPI001E1CB908|nr:dynein light chain Tctex-type protein 2B-like [Portunus trituberculatus]